MPSCVRGTLSAKMGKAEEFLVDLQTASRKLKSHLFLTGSTGTIGGLWLPLLLADESRRITALVRNPERAFRHPRVTVLTGDLRISQLGLDHAAWRSLTNSITEIVHCAADIRFNRSLEEARAVNTAGTRTLLRMARDAKKLERFAHLSTTFVMGRDAGELPEREYGNRSGFINTYEQAKYEAEREVFDAMRNVPAAVFRVSSVAGTQTNYFHQALRLIPRNPFPVMAGVAEYRVDLISAEWAASTLACLFERHFRAGAVYHVCAGRAASIAVGCLIEMAFAAMGVQRRPAMVPLEEFERFTERFLRNGEREPIKAMLRSVASFLPHLAIDQSFQNTATMARLQDGHFLPADSAEVVRNVLARMAVPAR